MISELERKISLDQIRAGRGPALAHRLGIATTPNRNSIVCTCVHAQGCTCSVPTHDAKRPTFGDPRLIVAVMALRHLDDRLSRLEESHAARRASQGQPPQAAHPHEIIAAAESFKRHCGKLRTKGR